jgi:uncharacterized protein
MLDFEVGFYMVGFEEKALSENDDAWEFKGYGAITGNRDLGGDIIVPGAMKKALSSPGHSLRLHKMHDVFASDRKSFKPQVGIITDYEEDDKGLLIEGELPKILQEAREIVAMVKPRGKKGIRGFNGLSIGYQTVKSRKGTEGGLPTRFLEEIIPFEVSFVDRAMNPKADLTHIKSLADDKLSIEEFKSLSDREREVRLKMLGLSDTLAKQFVRLARDERGSTSERDVQTMPDFAGLISNAAKRIAQ